ncbi:MAG: hypothetical protein K9H64_16960 [Bacteroidales bacterium]|nr:hypothetical protein [Bacteroidales bacterium]MCF8457676.1 hypothetical protein [Bacteroidales bacterium]
MKNITFLLYRLRIDMHLKFVSPKATSIQYRHLPIQLAKWLSAHFIMNLVLIAFTLLSCVDNPVKNKNQKNEESSEAVLVKGVEKLAGGFVFTEGPAVDANRNVYFTDIPNNLILIWTVNNKLDTFRLNSGHANGLFPGKQNAFCRIWLRWDDY